MDGFGRNPCFTPGEEKVPKALPTVTRGPAMAPSQFPREPFSYSIFLGGLAPLGPIRRPLSPGQVCSAKTSIHVPKSRPSQRFSSFLNPPPTPKKIFSFNALRPFQLTGNNLVPQSRPGPPYNAQNTALVKNKPPGWEQTSVAAMAPLKLWKVFPPFCGFPSPPPIFLSPKNFGPEKSRKKRKRSGRPRSFVLRHFFVAPPVFPTMAPPFVQPLPLLVFHQNRESLGHLKTFFFVSPRRV